MRTRTVATAIALVIAVSAVAADRPNVAFESQQAQISGDPAKPRRHFRVPNAAELSPEDAKRIYARIGGDIEEAYELSGIPSPRPIAAGNNTTRRPTGRRPMDGATSTTMRTVRLPPMAGTRKPARCRSAP